MPRTSGAGPPPDRALWVAELEHAVRDAQELAWRIGVTQGENPLAKQLYGRLEEIRSELMRIRPGVRAASGDELRALLWPDG